MYELHGNISRNKCITCGRVYEKLPDENLQTVPVCDCGGMIRPDVVWFGEMLPEETLRSAFRAAERAQVFLSVGTSALVQPAASLPIVAKQRGAYIVEVNIETTLLTSYADEFYEGRSGDILSMFARECGYE